MSQNGYAQHYDYLKNKWTDKEQQLNKKLWKKHKEALDWFVHQSKHITASSLGSLILLTATPGLQSATVLPAVRQTSQFAQIDHSTFLISDLYGKLPSNIVPLSQEQKERIAAILSNRFGLPVRSELQGVQLNTNYGLIGEEQHLARYPGDTMNSQLPIADDAAKYWSSGMAPGLGAWGYFASSSATMTDTDVAREKWYIAVQTFLSPGYYTNVAQYNAFFKYRKILVVNPQNGKAVVSDIADAGPSEWTGKSLGGSPEVMSYLERVDGAAKGPVLYFFIDDPNDTVPLGPISVK